MKKLTFVFDEDLFGAFQRGDWRKQDEVETAIEHFLDDMDTKKIRASNGEGFDRCADFIQVSFDTRYANKNDKNDEYLILKIKDVARTKEIPDAYLFSSHPILLPIERGDKLVFEKNRNVARIMVR